MTSGMQRINGRHGTTPDLYLDKETQRVMVQAQEIEYCLDCNKWHPMNGLGEKVDKAADSDPMKGYRLIGEAIQRIRSGEASE